MPRRRVDAQIQLLLRLLDQAYDKKAWHGTTLRGSLRGLTAKQALWRPAPRRHNIWEIVLHAAYWKYIVHRKISGRTDVSFPCPGSNWFPLPNSWDAKAWKKDVALLQDQHDQLRAAVERFPAAKLYARARKSVWSYAEHIYGIAHHDLYHAGQIQLLKRLQRQKATAAR